MSKPEDNEEKLRKKLSLIENRDWDNINITLTSLPDIANSPGKAPEIGIDELKDIETLLKTPKKGTSNHEEEASSLFIRSFAKEGLFQIHKANFIFKLALLGLSEDYGCPSLSIFYQAAYTCADGILKLHGVHKANLTGAKKQFIIDIFSSIPKKKTTPPPAPTLRLIDLDGLGINHKAFWKLFHKTVVKTNYSDQKLKSFKDSFRNLDPESFMIQRNYINYRTTYWPFDELRSELEIKSLRKILIEKQILLSDSLNPLDTHYIPLLAQKIIEYGNNLIYDLAKSSRAFQEEANIINTFENDFSKVLKNDIDDIQLTEGSII